MCLQLFLLPSEKIHPLELSPSIIVAGYEQMDACTVTGNYCSGDKELTDLNCNIKSWLDRTWFIIYCGPVCEETELLNRIIRVVV